MATQRFVVELEFEKSCLDKLIAALDFFGTIAADYPDDERFQTFTDQVLDALGYEQRDAGST